MLHAGVVHAYAFLVKLIPIVWNLTCIAVNRTQWIMVVRLDSWLSGVWANRWLLYPVDDGSVYVTWSRVGTTCIVSAFVFAWDCNMLGCLPVLQFFCCYLLCILTCMVVSACWIWIYAKMGEIICLWYMLIEKLIIHVNYEKSHPYFNDFRLKLATQELVRMALELCHFKSA